MFRQLWRTRFTKQSSEQLEWRQQNIRRHSSRNGFVRKSDQIFLSFRNSDWKSTNFRIDNYSHIPSKSICSSASSARLDRISLTRACKNFLIIPKSFSTINNKPKIYKDQFWNVIKPLIVQPTRQYLNTRILEQQSRIFETYIFSILIYLFNFLYISLFYF